MAERLIEALEPYDLMFVDQPVLPEHAEALDALSERTTAPVATGERFYSRYDFKPLLTRGSVSVIQPDVPTSAGSPNSGR